MSDQKAITPAERPSKSLLRSTSLVAFMTMLSRILGMIRDIVYAYYFGAEASFDAFSVAFKIPNFLRRLFAEGAFSQAFVPVLSEYQQKRSHDEVHTFISHITGTLGGILAVVTIISVIASPLIILLFAPGFIQDPHRYHLASSLLRITFPYLIFISLTALSGSILNTYGNFGVPAFTPVFLNLTLVCAAIFFSPYFDVPVSALAWGVFIAGILQLLFQVPFLWRLRLVPRPRFTWHDSGVRRVIKLMLPAIFGVSVAQVNLLIDTLFASFLAYGSISWLYYSERLMNFPLGVFGVAISTVILPHLSRQHANNSEKEFSKALDWGIRSILLIALPAAIGLYFLAGQLLVTILSHGKFDSHAVMMSSLSLRAFSIGVPAFMLVKVFAASFYARQNIKTPVKVGVIAMVANMLLNLILIFPLAHAGLALATSIAAYINSGLLFYLLLKEEKTQFESGWPMFALRLVVSNALMIAWLTWARAPLMQWLDWDTVHRVSHLLLLVGVAAAIYFMSLMALGLRWRDIR